jgi:putative peptide zinc metalloprotease protein
VNAPHVATAVVPAPGESATEVESVIPFRIRPDLTAVRQAAGPREVWVIHDPVALNYFHFGPTEWFLLQQFDGASTLRQLQERFTRRFSQAISPIELKLFIARVVSDGLVQAVNRLGEGSQLYQSAQRQRWRQWGLKAIQLLSIRFPGVNPQWLLEGLTPLGRIVFHPAVMLAVVAACLATAAVAIARFDVVYSRLPELVYFLQGEQLLLLALALAFVKVLHELGHAISCQVFGGRCHEIGVMLLCFIPCLYCDVSDAWMFPNRWRRMAVSAAGVYVELALATVFFWLWMASIPGPFNAFALNVVLVCSVNTLLANGNPLLRYDGYFILSDLVGVPNLASRAQVELARVVGGLFFHVSPADRASHGDWRLAAYAVASFLYRVLVILGILYAFHRILEPLGLSVIVWPLAIMALVSLVLPWVAGMRRGIRWNTLATMRWSHVILVLILIAGIGGVAGWLPLQFRIRAPMTVEIHRPAVVYAAVDGRLVWTVTPQTVVRAGDPIARLENEDLQYQLDRLTRQTRVHQTNLDSLRRQNQTGSVVLEIHLLEAKLADLQQQQSLVSLENQKCEIRAIVDGTVYPRWYESPPRDDERTLPTWRGDLLNEANRGCWVEKGTAICQISRQGLQAVAYVSQQDIDRVQVGKAADVTFDQCRPQAFVGTVAEISREQADRVPTALVTTHRLKVKPDSSGRIQTAEPVFRVTLELPNWPAVYPGTGGTVKIHAPPETWGEKLGRFFRRTFRWE